MVLMRKLYPEKGTGLPKAVPPRPSANSQSRKDTVPEVQGHEGPGSTRRSSVGKGFQAQTLLPQLPLGYSPRPLSTLKALRSSAVKNSPPRKASCLTVWSPLLPKRLFTEPFFQVMFLMVLGSMKDMRLQLANGKASPSWVSVWSGSATGTATRAEGLGLCSPHASHSPSLGWLYCSLEVIEDPL